MAAAQTKAHAWDTGEAARWPGGRAMVTLQFLLWARVAIDGSRIWGGVLRNWKDRDDINC